MGHHLQVVVVLDVVARDRCDLSIHSHELGVEGSKWWSVKVDNGKVDVGHLLRRRKTNVGCLPSG